MLFRSSVIIMAVVTYVPRAIPISIFQRQIKSKYIKSFLYYVPYSVLAALTFPSIFYVTGNNITTIIGTIVALVLAYFEKSLLVVAIGAIISVFLSEIIFIH